MFVTGLPYWHFLSFHPAFPPLSIRVERDEKIQMVLREGLAAFLERFDAAWALLVDRHGQPPARVAPVEPVG
jgi:hypothetical protein